MVIVRSRPIQCERAQTNSLTDDGRLQVDEHGPRHVFSGPGLAEERVETVVASADGLVGRHLSVGLDAMFQAVKLPARVADLHAGLANVYGYALTLEKWKKK